MLSLGMSKVNPINLLKDLILTKLSNLTLGFTNQHKREVMKPFSYYGLNSVSFLIMWA